jgi:hypothetical protein
MVTKPFLSFFYKIKNRIHLYSTFVIVDVDMMMTRSRTLVAATADAVTLSNSNSMVIVNKQVTLISMTRLALD